MMCRYAILFLKVSSVMIFVGILGCSEAEPEAPTLGHSLLS